MYMYIYEIPKNGAEKNWNLFVAFSMYLYVVQAQFRGDNQGPQCVKCIVGVGDKYIYIDTLSIDVLLYNNSNYFYNS